MRDARLGDRFSLEDDEDDEEDLDVFASALRTTDLLSSRNINDS